MPAHFDIVSPKHRSEPDKPVRSIGATKRFQPKQGPLSSRPMRPASPLRKPKDPLLNSTKAGGIITESPRSKRPRTQNRWLLWLDVAIALGLAIALVATNQTPTVPEACIAAYAIYVFVRRTMSRFTFGVALVAIIGAVISFTVLSNPDLVNKYTTYAFFLLVIGTGSLLVESR